MSYAQEIAATILTQMGGKKFTVMTGSNQYIYGGGKDDEPPYLRMNLKKNKWGANRLHISLMGDDTYTMYFYKITFPSMGDYKITKEKIISGLFFDQLQETFTEVTGMYTSL